MTLAGCVRREGRNSDCRWPGEPVAQSATPAHLSADAEFAEDLAIRFADTHHGLRTGKYISGEVYKSERDKCMGALFQQVAAQHRVAAEQVTGALGQNRTLLDIGVNLAFGLLFLVAAWFTSRMIWRKYPITEYGLIPGVAMGLFASTAMALGCMLLGEQWAWMVETYRIGNGHMSYRGSRLWWTQHRSGVFWMALFSFWICAGIAGRRIAARLK